MQIWDPEWLRRNHQILNAPKVFRIPDNKLVSPALQNNNHDMLKIWKMHGTIPSTLPLYFWQRMIVNILYRATCEYCEYCEWITKKINKKQNMIDDKVWYDMTTTTTKTYKGVCLWIKRCTALSHIWLCNANISYNLTLSQRYKAHKKEHAFDKCSKMKWMKLFDGVRLITHDWTKIYLIFRVTINYTRHYRQNTSIIAMASVHSKVHGANMGPTRVL